MHWLTRLPNEILFQVLRNLDSWDINNMLAIPLFQRRFEGLFWLITDSKVPLHRHVQDRIHVDRWWDASKSIGCTFQSIIEIHSLSNFSDTMLNEIQKHFFSINIIILKHYHAAISSDQPFSINELGPRVRSLTFENLTSVSFRDTVVDPSRTKFPFVTLMTLDNVWITPTATKLQAPNLIDLEVHGRFFSVDRAIDYENTRLKRLMLHCIQDMDVWKDINCPSLESIEIDVASMVIFKNLKFENLQVMTIDSTNVELFAYADLPQVQFLVIFNSDAGLSIHDINAPRLRRLYLSTNTIEKMYDMNIASLQDGHFGQHAEELFLQISDNIDTSILHSLQSAVIEHTSSILEHTPNLTALTVLRPFFMKDTYDLPKLTTLTIEPDCTSYIHLFPQSLFQSIKKICLKDMSMLIDLPYIHFHSPNLTNVTLEDHYMSRLHNAAIPNIETLEVHSFSDPQNVFVPNEVSVKGCVFPDVVEFKAENYTVNPSVRFSELEFIAPLMKYMSVVGLRIELLDVSRFEKLEKLVATGGVHRVVLGGGICLEALDLSENECLEDVKSGKLEKLKSLECTGTGYFAYHELDAPLLEKVVLDKEVKFIEIS